MITVKLCSVGMDPALLSISVGVCVPTGAPAPTIADDETDTETINTSPRR